MRLLKHKWPVIPVNARVCNSKNGFTLIEILVVVIIIGIALSLAVAKLYPDENERLREETDRAVAMLEAARDEAAFSGHTIAFNISENTLTFYERDTRSAEIKWLPVNNPQLEARPFAEGISAALRLGGSGGQTSDKNALALFQPAGVGAPFEVLLASNFGQRVIVADALGNLSLGNLSLGNLDTATIANSSPVNAR